MRRAIHAVVSALGALLRDQVRRTFSDAEVERRSLTSFPLSEHEPNCKVWAQFRCRDSHDAGTCKELGGIAATAREVLSQCLFGLGLGQSDEGRRLTTQNQKQPIN